MRAIRLLSLLLAVAAGCALAQRHGGSAGGGFHGGIGTGTGHVGTVGHNGGHPGFGGGWLGGGRMGGGMGFPGRGLYGGYYGYRGFNNGFFSWPIYTGVGYWPWYGDSYLNAYSDYPVYPYAPGPNVTVVYPAVAPPAPAPVVFSEPVRPVVRDYSDGNYGLPAAPATTSEPPIYLIAFKDQVIRPALAYWAEGKTLHYVSLDHQQKQAPVDTVDRALSTQLNRERRVPFRLPE